MIDRLIITCEHGGALIPDDYRGLFESANEILKTHRAWDAGALHLARHLETSFDAPFIFSETSRLLVDLNRSLGHPQLFSEWTRSLAEIEKTQILIDHYHPYHNQVREQLNRSLPVSERILHLSVHSFTPLWNGKRRPTDFGFLFDPGRPSERQFIDRWKQELARSLPSEFVIHRNRPYRGTSDGLTTMLRNELPASQYLGIELELNQKHLNRAGHFPRSLIQAVSKSLRKCVETG